jgi:hypothetical protein
LRPAPRDARIEPTPVENLHFLRGLSHFYARRHHQALAELIQCGASAERDGLPGLWRARCYLAQSQHGHAYVELVRLERNGLGSVAAAEHAEMLRTCRARLAPEDLRIYERLATARRGSGGRRE